MWRVPAPSGPLMTPSSRGNVRLPRHDKLHIDALWATLAPAAADGLVVAPVPADDLLVEVVCDAPAIVAGPILRSVLVPEEIEVGHVVDAEGVHAPFHEKVLASRVDASEAGMALLEEEVQSLCGHHLEGAHELELVVDIFEIHPSTKGRPELDQVHLEAVREKDSIGINLDRPVEVPVGAFALDLLPNLLEGVDVGERAPLGLRSRGTVVEVVAIALEDAEAVLLDVIRELGLRAPEGLGSRCIPVDDGEAVQGGALHSDLLSCGTHGLVHTAATEPGAIPIRRGRTQLAAREVLGLLIARVRVTVGELRIAGYVVAALRLRAVLTAPGAHLGLRQGLLPRHHGTDGVDYRMQLRLRSRIATDGGIEVVRRPHNLRNTLRGQQAGLRVGVENRLPAAAVLLASLPTIVHGKGLWRIDRLARPRLVLLVDGLATRLAGRPVVVFLVALHPPVGAAARARAILCPLLGARRPGLGRRRVLCQFHAYVVHAHSLAAQLLQEETLRPRGGSPSRSASGCILNVEQRRTSNAHEGGRTGE
mmetsp:Transcript_99733/g.253571  ORF Transcript_99733/g.253571 Transcript_99733/m.253571 type:complete len:536 (-) Transcript_99733:209-1816(-)